MLTATQYNAIHNTGRALDKSAAILHVGESLNYSLLATNKLYLAEIHKDSIFTGQ